MVQSLNNQLVELASRRREQEDEFNKLRKKQEDEHQKPLDDLEKERALLELHSHKAERRSILRDLTGKAQHEIRAAHTPKEAKLARILVFLVIVLIGGFAGLFAYSGFAEITNINARTDISNFADADGNINWDLYKLALESFNFTSQILFFVKGLLSSFVSIDAFVFAAKWMQKYYDEEINSAKEIERFNYDLSRASWIIETVLEV